MGSLFNQPLAHRFGISLQQMIESGEWHVLEVAVAWARRSGTQHVLPALTAFLTAGGATRFTVGVDIENTSREGLEDLLFLGSVGMAETYIYHNEDPGVTFHPKVYLFSSEDRARLIVGSNNLTQAGLFTNTEAGLQIDAAIDEEVIIDARTALASWRDTTEGFAKRLDRILLNDLVTEGYVLSERALQQRRRQSQQAARSGTTFTRRRLFSRRTVTAPPVRTATGGPPPQTAVGRVLLMRVRRASETERRTQIQVPIRVVRTGFFGAANEIRSAHNNERHQIRVASARGGINTMKLEVPEINAMNDPVMRLEQTPTEILYQAYDSVSTLGRPIMDALEAGRRMNPPITSLTLPRDPARSTWWRFI